MANFGFLPLKINLPESQNGGLWMDVLPQNDVTKAYHVMREAADMGDNVGLDEYIDEDQFDTKLENSKMFSLKSLLNEPKADEQIKAVMVIGPCRLSRGVRACLSELQIFFARELSPHCASTLKEIVPVSERIAVSLNYTGCVIQLSVANSDWLKELSQLDYVITACLPRCVDIKSKGLIDSFVLYKKMHGAAQKELNLKDLTSLPEVTSNSLTDEEYRHCNVKQLPGLPLQFREGGVTYVMRAVRPGEDKVIYDLLMGHAQRGFGLSVTDFPTLGFFRKQFLVNNYYALVEEKETGDLESASIIRLSPFVRHNNANAYTIIGVRNFGFRKQRPSLPKFMHVIHDMMRAMGGKELLGTVIASQYHPIRMNSALGYTHVGALPDGVYITGQGWQDILFMNGKLDSLREASVL